MTMRKIWTLVLSTILAFPALAQQIDGYWQGRLDLPPKDTLTVGVNIRNSQDSIALLLDSPDQYAFDIPATEVLWADSVLRWKVPSVGASFVGRLSADGNSIVGTFEQTKVKFPLTLRRGFERRVMNRPQTPHEPFPYTEEIVSIKDKSGRYNLINGTLTVPAKPAKALVVLISGSGWQDRDESLFGHKPFAVIADYLTRQGYAVYRYDDYPKAIFAKSTTYDFADGVTMILDSFSHRADFRNLPVGLLGHSEGSLVASMVAARDKRVAFTIHLGGVAQLIPEVLLYQLEDINRVGGTLSEQEIQNSIALTKSLYQSLAKAKDPKEAASLLSKVWEQQVARLTPDERERYGYTPAGKMTAVQQMTSPWFFAFFNFDTKSYVKKVKCPVLAIGGEKDLQVDAASNNALFEKYLPKNKKHKFVVEPDANHLLQPCTTGSPEEYGQIETTIKPEVLERISSWLQDLNCNK